MVKVLEYYKIKHNIKEQINKIDKIETINSLMGLEGNIRQEYYSYFDLILPSNFPFIKRMMNPPGNMTNALISFANALLYSTILNEIYHTQLNPTISYLHEPRDGRFSLTYDISEIFKPFFIDRLIFNITKRKIMKKEHFNILEDRTYLNEKGKNIFINEYNKKLEKTIKLENGKKVSYQRLIRMEINKLKKHILNQETYKPFTIKW